MSDRGREKELKITKKIFTDVAKRRQITGSVTIGGTAVAIYTDRFTARSIVVSNPDTATHWYQVLDGTGVLIGKVNVSANTKDSLVDLDLPFYTNVSFNSDSTLMVFTSGGFVP